MASALPRRLRRLPPGSRRRVEVRIRGKLLLRRRVYEVLDVGSMHDRISVLVHRLLVVIVLLSVAAVILESVPSINASSGRVFYLFEVFAATLFTLEYGLRLWAAVEHPPLRHLPPWKARLAYAVQPALIIDLMAILPVFLALLGPNEFQILLIFRLLRFFKLTRYSPGMRSLLEAVHAERRALVACAVILSGLMIVAATAMHVAEGKAQPDKFGSIPEAMYWAIITLTTVGYGDVYPITSGGRIVAGMTAVMGLVMLSLPVGIIATAFAEVIHRRDFVVTWNMVARVPIFAGLEALEIAAIMRFLRSRAAEPGSVIVRRGELASSMYFIAGGSVEVELPDRRVRLDDGHFFGEIAVLQRRRRVATVRAIDSVKLLVLDRDDFVTLTEMNPLIGERIRAVAEARLSQPVEPNADIDQREIGP